MAEPDRFFVVIVAPDKDRLRDLNTRGLDLFVSTAASTRKQTRIEGLLSLEEIGQLARDGYQVTVESTMEARARATETTSPEEWLQAMEQ